MFVWELRTLGYALISYLFLLKLHGCATWAFPQDPGPRRAWCWLNTLVTLNFLVIFEQGTLHFFFTLGSAEYAGSHDCPPSCHHTLHSHWSWQPFSVLLWSSLFPLLPTNPWLSFCFIFGQSCIICGTSLSIVIKSV